MSTIALVRGVGNVDTTNTNDANMVGMRHVTVGLLHSKHALLAVPPTVQLLLRHVPCGSSIRADLAVPVRSARLVQGDEYLALPRTMNGVRTCTLITIGDAPVGQVSRTRDQRHMAAVLGKFVQHVVDGSPSPHSGELSPRYSRLLATAPTPRRNKSCLFLVFVVLLGQ